MATILTLRNCHTPPAASLDDREEGCHCQTGSSPLLETYVRLVAGSQNPIVRYSCNMALVDWCVNYHLARASLWTCHEPLCAALHHCLKPQVQRLPTIWWYQRKLFRELLPLLFGGGVLLWALDAWCGRCDIRKTKEKRKFVNRMKRKKWGIGPMALCVPRHFRSLSQSNSGKKNSYQH